MTLEKVREILLLNLMEAGRKMDPDLAIALGIAIETVKAVQKARAGTLIGHFRKLPGETKE